VEPSSAPWRVIEPTEPEATPGSATAASGLPWPAIGVALVAVVIGVAAILANMQGGPVVGVDGAAVLDAGSGGRGGSPSPDPASTRPLLVVDVGGAVVRPGVYRLPAGSRIGDAIAAAGGYGASVDAGLVDRQLNLAAEVKDGDKVRVPARGDTQAPAAGGGSPSAPGQAGGPIDLNSASAEALDTLPGVGPATAAKIIAAREQQPFASVDDLLSRKVLGAATLEKLRPLVTVGP
jgi:competence protein ComEA